MAVGGVVAGLIARAAVLTSPSVGSAPQLLPVLSQTGYLFPKARASAPDGAGIWIGIIVAALGVIVLLVGGILAWTRLRGNGSTGTGTGGRRTGTTVALLVGAGTVMTVVGFVGGLVARSFADRASRLASEATRLISDPTNPIGLAFDPTSAHSVPPDFTLFWIAMAIAALGALLLVFGIAVAATRRRAAKRGTQPIS